MKAVVTIALIIFCFIATETKAQETWRFDDGGYLYADELEEVVGTKKIKEWKKDTIVSIPEFKRSLQIRGIFVMKNYNQGDVEGNIVQEYGSDRIFLILNERVSYYPYMLFRYTNEYGEYEWNRVILSDGIPTNILNSRLIIAGRAK